MAFLGERNGAVDRRFSGIATEYMRHGEDMGVRWDYAFFQMMLETGNLTFHSGRRNGDVKARQNNFAGLGAVGNGETGESFKDLASGVRAHLQHLLIYAGVKVDAPVAERTRKVQEWGILTSWQKGFKRPITFADLATKWAPDDGTYAGQVQSIAQKFYDTTCKQPDPDPDRIAEARGIKTSPRQKTASAEAPQDLPGAKIASTAIDQQRKEAAVRSLLGAAPVMPQPATPAATEAETSERPTQAAVSVPFKLINPPKAEAQPQGESAAPPAAADVPPVSATPPKAPAAAAPPAKSPSKAEPTKCRVWTASYGGSKAVIIKAIADQMVNYTVLDVNEGQERREAEAFISAYAKSGAITAEYANQSQALDRAFELCPEG